MHPRNPSCPAATRRRWAFVLLLATTALLGGVQNAVSTPHTPPAASAAP